MQAPTFREHVDGPILRSLRHIWPSDRFLWPAARFLLAKRKPRSAPEIVTNADGFRLRLRLQEYPDGSMYFGVYEVATVRLFRHLLRPGDTAIDVGGNIGYMSLHMARLVGPAGRVHAFEPVPASADRFAENMSRNGVDSIVTLHRSAAGAAHGETVMHTFAHDDTSRHVLASMKPLHAGHHKISAPVVPLDEVVKGPVRLLKIDIEGAEVGAIQGASSLIARHRPHIILENNPPALAAFGYAFADCFAAIQEATGARYRVVQVDGVHRSYAHNSERLHCLPAGNIWLRPAET